MTPKPRVAHGIPDLAEPDASAVGNLYRALVSQWIHQDRLMWGRTQLLTAVQGATLGAGYALYSGHKNDALAAGVLAIGLALTLCILRLIALDEADRDGPGGLIPWAGRQLVACADKDGAGGNLLQNEVVQRALETHRPPRRLTGGKIARAFAGVLVLIDLGFLLRVIVWMGWNR